MLVKHSGPFPARSRHIRRFSLLTVGRSCHIIAMYALTRVSREVTPINRQSYMAEVGNLLALITDEETRNRLIAQMEQMFDAAEDEEKLIEQISTKGGTTEAGLDVMINSELGDIVNRSFNEAISRIKK